MKRLISSLAAVGLLAVGTVATAQVAETFEGLDPLDLPGSSSTLAGGSWSDPFGSAAPQIQVTEDNAAAFPLASTDFFASYGGATEQLLTLTADNFETTDTIQFAFGLRFDNGPSSADQANNFTEILAIRNTDFPGFASLFGLSIVDGDLTTNPWNGFADVVLEGAFDSSNASFLGNDWLLVAAYVRTNATDGEVELRIYSLDGTDLNLEHTYTNTGVANTRVATFYNEIDFGLRNAFPAAANDNQVSVADVTIYPTADFTRTEFFDTFDTATSVDEWMLH